MNSESSRKIIEQARTWLGTPYHHQARLKGVGCDCLGLVVGVADELGLTHRDGRLLRSFDETDYSHQPDGARLTAMLQSVLDEIPKEEAEPGDLVLFSIEGNPQHVGLLTDYEGLGVIHCYAPSRKVVEHRLDKKWQSRIVKVFRWQQ
ncbi:MAG: C40 family peptidase [Pseudomonadota bacterium]|nr:C40 family peptidase [Pseudomonadota bacterium]MDE3036967.1 C40 family peptidase [Pseudomonadota bacterium]